MNFKSRIKPPDIALHQNINNHQAQNMKTRIRLILILFTILASSCRTKNNEGSTEQWKDEIIATEKAFAKMAMTKGIPQAFIAYAADDAVLLRNNKLIIGKDSLRASF